MRVCIGGTFNRFHKGHRLLIDTALEKAGSDGFVFIGVSNGSLVKNKPKVESFEQRRNQVLLFLQSKKQRLPTVVIEPIKTVEGPTLTMDFDAIVVSEETKQVAENINEQRKNKGLAMMKIITIPIVLAEDDKKISSSRIIHDEIDCEGHVL